MSICRLENSGSTRTLCPTGYGGETKLPFFPNALGADTVIRDRPARVADTSEDEKMSYVVRFSVGEGQHQYGQFLYPIDREPVALKRITVQTIHILPQQNLTFSSRLTQSMTWSQSQTASRLAEWSHSTIKSLMSRDHIEKGRPLQCLFRNTRGDKGMSIIDFLILHSFAVKITA